MNCRNMLRMISAVFLVALALPGCSNQPDNTIKLHGLMKGTIAPNAQILWDGASLMMDEEGQPSTAKVQAADWSRLEAAAMALHAAATQVVAADEIKVAEPDARIQDEGNPGAWGAADVQHAINRKTDDFRRHAQKLGSSADAFLAAVHSRNAARFLQLSSDLDKDCEGCHVRFWYPMQK